MFSGAWETSVGMVGFSRGVGMHDKTRTGGSGHRVRPLETGTIALVNSIPVKEAGGNRLRRRIAPFLGHQISPQGVFTEACGIVIWFEIIRSTGWR